MLGYFVEAGGSVLDTQEEYEAFKAFFAIPSNQLKEVSRSIDIAEQTILLNISRKQYMEKYLKDYFNCRVCFSKSNPVIDECFSDMTFRDVTNKQTKWNSFLRTNELNPLPSGYSSSSGTHRRSVRFASSHAPAIPP